MNRAADESSKMPTAKYLHADLAYFRTLVCANRNENNLINPKDLNTTATCTPDLRALARESDTCAHSRISSPY